MRLLCRKFLQPPLLFRTTPEAKGELKPVPASCWGYPGIIRHDGPYTYNRIFVHENTFDSNDEVWIDIGDSMSYDINPTEFFNDIFGDG